MAASPKNTLSYTLHEGSLSLYVGGELLIGPIPPATTLALTHALNSAASTCPCSDGWTFDRQRNQWTRPDHDPK